MATNGMDYGQDVEGDDCGKCKLNDWRSVDLVDVPFYAEALSASRNQGDPSFGVLAGTQCASMVAVAAVYAFHKPIGYWTEADMDLVLDEGNNKHIISGKKDGRNYVDIRDCSGIFEFEDGHYSLACREFLTSSLVENGALGALKSLDYALEEVVSKKLHVSVLISSFTFGIFCDSEKVYLFNSHCSHYLHAPLNEYASVVSFDRDVAAEAVSQIMRAYYSPPSSVSLDEQTVQFSLLETTIHVPLSPLSPQQMPIANKPSPSPQSSSSSPDFKKFRKRKQKRLQSPIEADVQGGVKWFPGPIDNSDLNKLKTILRGMRPEDIQDSTVQRDQILTNKFVVYDAKKVKSATDYFWKHEGIRWGKPSNHNLPKRQPEWRVIYYKTSDNLGRKLKKTVYFYGGKGYNWQTLRESEFPYIIVSYEGDGDPKMCVGKPHGNAKLPSEKAAYKASADMITNSPTISPSMDKNRVLPPYLPSSKQCLEQINNQLSMAKSAAPCQAFVTLQTKAQVAGDPTLQPRNPKQVYNAKAATKRSEFPEDQRALLEYHAMMFPDLLPDSRTFEGKKFAVCVLPQLDAHISEVLRVCKGLVMDYDSTFNCGRFYVSILSMRHPFFEEEPVIPFAVILHESKAKVGHEMLFLNRNERFPKLNTDRTILISDREASFKNVVSRTLPKISHVFCHPHIGSDIEAWARKKFKASVWKRWKHDVLLLLRETTWDAFEDRLREYLADDEDSDRRWHSRFQQYFQKNLEADVRKSCGAATFNFDIFDEDSGVTNNAAESENSTYKKLIGKQREMYEAALIAYLHMTNKLNEIQKGMKGESYEYTLKDEMTEIVAQVKTFEVADTVGSLGLHKIFQSGRFTNAVTDKPPQLSTRLSVHGLADLLYRMPGRIMLVCGEFFVRGIGGKICHVNIDKESCTCGRGYCEHIIAVMRTARKAYSPKRTDAVNLTQVAKKLVKVSVGKKRAVGQRVRLPLRSKATFRKLKNNLLPEPTKVTPKQVPQTQAVRTTAIAPTAVPPGKRGKRVAVTSEQSAQEDTNRRNTVESSKTVAMTSAPRSSSRDDSVMISHSEISLDDDPTVLQIVKQVPEKLAKIPVVTKANADDILLLIDGIDLTLQDVKTLDPSPTEREQEILKGPKRQTYNPGWINDKIIDAVLESVKSSTPQHERIHVIASSRTAVILRGNEEAQGRLMRSLQRVCWESIDHLFVPLSLGNHWILIHIRFEPFLNVLTVYDSMEGKNESTVDTVIAFLRRVYPDWSNWEFRVPTNVPVQKDASSCGAYTAYFGYTLLKFGKVAKNPVSERMLRNFILNLLFDACDLLTANMKKKCKLCKEPVKKVKKGTPEPFKSCVRCSVPVHERCLLNRQCIVTSFVCSVLSNA